MNCSVTASKLASTTRAQQRLDTQRDGRHDAYGPYTANTGGVCHQKLPSACHWPHEVPSGGDSSSALPLSTRRGLPLTSFTTRHLHHPSLQCQWQLRPCQMNSRHRHDAGSQRHRRTAGLTLHCPRTHKLGKARAGMASRIVDSSPQRQALQDSTSHALTGRSRDRRGARPTQAGNIRRH